MPIVLSNPPLNDSIKLMASQNYTNISNFTVQRIQKFLNSINSTDIDLITLRLISFKGIPDECKGLRSCVWKLILDYYPPNATLWYPVSKQKAEEFHHLQLKMSDQTMQKGENPLSSKSEGGLNNLLTDRLLWQSIEKDIKRTRADVQFFVQPRDATNSKFTEQLIKQSESLRSEMNANERHNYILTHGDVIADMLFIYAKCNSKIKYVQGMNELLGTLYYTFYKDINSIVAPYIESDSYFMFCILMQEMAHNYVSTVSYTHLTLPTKRIV